MFDPGFPAKSLTMVRCLSSGARVFAWGHDGTQEGLTKPCGSNRGWTLNSTGAFSSVAHERPTVSTRSLNLWRFSNVALEQYQVFEDYSAEWQQEYKENGESLSLVLTNFL